LAVHRDLPGPQATSYLHDEQDPKLHHHRIARTARLEAFVSDDSYSH
jgi:hypothetical protein